MRFKRDGDLSPIDEVLVTTGTVAVTGGFPIGPSLEGRISMVCPVWGLELELVSSSRRVEKTWGIVKAVAVRSRDLHFLGV